MKKIYRAKRKIIPIKKFYVNEDIRAIEVRLIDENGEMLGVFPTNKAIEMANERNLDLVEVSPKAEPPVAKIIDYGKFQYQQEKLLKKQKSLSKKIETKCIRISARISKHDLGIRIEQAKKFLDKGNKVKIEVVLKGREMQFAENAKNLLKEFTDNLQTDIIFEQPLTKLGNRFSVQIAQKK